MALDIAHFAFGAAVTTLGITLLARTVRYPRTVIAIGGVWAMVPDVHLISPVARASLRAFHGSVGAEVFWLHRTLDRIDPADSKLFAAGMIAFFLVTTLLAEWHSYRTLRSSRTGKPSPGKREE